MTDAARPIPFALPDITEAEVDAASKAIRSGWVTSGPEMVKFEEEFAKHVGGQVESIAVNSATAGLHLALEACGIGPGDEVIVPTWTFTATAEVVRYVGATPVLVDIDPMTLNIDLDRVDEALSSATRAVIPVHMAGLGVDIESLRNLVGSQICIIEDAAHALPTVTNGSRVGACDHSDAAVFSFYATKTMTTGEGGMITTRSADVASRCRIMRLHGIDRDAFSRYRSDKPAWYYDVVAPGYKYNLSDPAAAMGRVQLTRSAEMHLARSRLAQEYQARLAELPVDLPSAGPSGDTHAWHLFILRIRPESPLTRDEFIAVMAEAGIGTSVHFIPLHMHTVWRNLLGLDEHLYPRASRAYTQVVSLPIYSAMSEDQQARVIDVATRLLS